MTEQSSFRKQFLAEIDKIRQLRRRYWGSVIAIPVALLLCVFAVELIHPIFLFVGFLPPFMVRIYHIKLATVRCPRCGEFYNVINPNDVPPRRQGKVGWGLLGAGSRCVHCGFAL